MPQEFKAFVSCSFDEKDKVVVDFFKRLIASFDLTSVIYDWQELGTIPDKVREHIRETDCLIAIATRRNEIGDRDWAPPDWLQQEVAIASAFEKPIAIFAEEGVKLGGILDKEQRKQKFTRDDFLKDIDKITRFLLNVRSSLDFEKSNAPTLLRHYLHIEEEVLSEERTVERVGVLMECLADELEATHHEMVLEDNTPGLSVRPEVFLFDCTEKPSNVNVTYQDVQKLPSRHLWKIMFTPPLRKGEKVKYAFKRVTPTTRPYTWEQLQERIRKESYIRDMEHCVACDWIMYYPTMDFHFAMKFPEGYQISNCIVDVKIGDAKLKAMDELQRIKTGKMLSVEETVGLWSINLRVPKPLLDHSYYIYYDPPSAEQIALARKA